jgi:hypothetical protein
MLRAACTERRSTRRRSILFSKSSRNPTSVAGKRDESSGDPRTVVGKETSEDLKTAVLALGLES